MEFDDALPADEVLPSLVRDRGMLVEMNYETEAPLSGIASFETSPGKRVSLFRELSIREGLKSDRVCCRFP